MASPFVMADPKDPEEVIGPARDGTMNVIKACAEVGGVKRVVLTSSCAAVSAGRECRSHKPIFLISASPVFSTSQVDSYGHHYYNDGG